MYIQQSAIDSAVTHASRAPGILDVEPSYPPKTIPMIIGHHDYDNGYMSERELRLRLLAIRDVKEKSYASGLTEVIQNSSIINQTAYAEKSFIFGDKKFLEPKNIPKIRELLTSDEFGFKVEFINNSPANSYIKTKLSYHELLVKFDEKNRAVAAFMFMSTHDKTACYDLEVAYVGQVDLGQQIEKAIGKYTKRRVFMATFKTAKNIMDYGDGPFVTFREEILETDAEMAKPSFYPWLQEEQKQTIAEFAHNYIASRAPVLLLYGPTGTGKTTLVRTMAKELNAVIVATSDIKIASSGAMIDTYRDLIKQAKEDLDPRPYILLFEDMDSLLMSRLNNNRDMARLLNETKGISSNRDIHIIFSTNITSLESIDAALLRPGRCFAKLNCRKLTLAQADTVRNDLGYDNFDLSGLAVDGMVTLAEAIEEMRILEEENKIKNQLLSNKMMSSEMIPFVG